MKNLPDSMLYWFPLIKDLDIPQPRTEVIPLTRKELDIFHNEQISDELVKKIEKIVTEKFKLPIFIRTDLASGKHGWKQSCFYDGTGKLWVHLLEVVTFNLCAGLVGLPFKALVVREFIPMDLRFTAFYGDMPVNPERRYFIDGGKVICHHPYWIEEAIEQSKPPSVENWKELAKELNTEGEKEIKLLMRYAEKVAKIFSGYWSIDFCKAKDEGWILIDMATGKNSWHPEGCLEKSYIGR